MDLDMIQDLLGGSNLPPPPSVQDLLSDVVPQVPSSPSPPPQSPSYLHLSAEHSYSKGAMDVGAGAETAPEPMEVETAHTPGSRTLAALNSTSDCYEAFLLNLLRVYTHNKMEAVTTAVNPDSESATGEPSTTPTEGNPPGPTAAIDSISPEAISALSHEQVQSLVTSNSANYDVIHQILAHKQKTEGGGGGSEGETGGGEDKTGGESAEGGSTLQQLQALQLTPEQLKQIQAQMEELIRTKQIVLPPDLSVEQQQQLLQSLILKHIHSQLLGHSTTPQPPTTTPQHTLTPIQQQPTPTPPSPHPNTSSSDTPNGGGSLPKPVLISKATVGSTLAVCSSPSKATVGSTLAKATVGSTLAAILCGGPEDQLAGLPASGGAGGGRAVKKEVPPPSSVQGGGSHPLSEASSQATTPTITAPSSTAPSAGVATRSGGRKKKDTKDPDEPKKPSSPYGVFFSDVYPSVLQANPRMSFSEASKLISAMWNAMGIDTKKQYHERSEKQKEVHQAYLASRKTETTPTDESATSPLVTMETKTLAEVAPPTQQSDSLVDMTTGAEERLGGTTVSQRQGVVAPPPPAPPAPTRVVVKELRHCVNDGCFKDSVYTESRGPRYCSNECVVQHVKSVFQEWVAQRKIAAT